VLACPSDETGRVYSAEALPKLLPLPPAAAAAAAVLFIKVADAPEVNDPVFDAGVEPPIVAVNPPAAA
jgi:hypothetical protein